MHIPDLKALFSAFLVHKIKNMVPRTYCFLSYYPGTQKDVDFLYPISASKFPGKNSDWPRLCQMSAVEPSAKATGITVFEPVWATHQSPNQCNNTWGKREGLFLCGCLDCSHLSPSTSLQPVDGESGISLRGKATVPEVPTPPRTSFPNHREVLPASGRQDMV